MPIYEYRCRSCGRVHEYLVGAAEAAGIVCRDCGGSDMEKIMSAASFIDRGSKHRFGATCCGREERCERPPCSAGGGCRRDGL